MTTKEETGFLLHKIDKKIKCTMDNEMSKHDMTLSQSMVLSYLHKNDGQLSQKKLQDLLKVSHPTMVGLVKRLEAKGYVECMADNKDKRNKIVKATELAREYKKDMQDTRRSFNNKMYKGISNEEIDLLHSLLSKMYENIV